jgi:hypothetical protein
MEKREDLKNAYELVRSTCVLFPVCMCFEEAFSWKEMNGEAEVVRGTRNVQRKVSEPFLLPLPLPTSHQEPLRTKTMAKEKIFFKRLEWSSKMIGQPVGPLKGEEGKGGGRRADERYGRVHGWLMCGRVSSMPSHLLSFIPMLTTPSRGNIAQVKIVIEYFGSRGGEGRWVGEGGGRRRRGSTRCGRYGFDL